VQLVDEIGNLAEIVAVAGVTHDDELAPRGGDSRFQRRAVAALGNANYGRAVKFGNFNRAVGRAVVRDSYFTAQARAANDGERLLHEKAREFASFRQGDADGNVQFVVALVALLGFRLPFQARELRLFVDPRLRFNRKLKFPRFPKLVNMERRQSGKGSEVKP
jgi:hypothetical protein